MNEDINWVAMQQATEQLGAAISDVASGIAVPVYRKVRQSTGDELLARELSVAAFRVMLSYMEKR